LALRKNQNLKRMIAMSAQPKTPWRRRLAALPSPLTLSRMTRKFPVAVKESLFPAATLPVLIDLLYASVPLRVNTPYYYLLPATDPREL
jgi:hypothetical protein